ncbi:AlpA family phage regulatory protein [Tunturiibacter gelidiferens]|uniref:AlpA family phage regulatory protein n=1 Tax=Tunturiibacter gelidiferens TaxID=3069689 RepID=UPI003D9ABF8B
MYDDRIVRMPEVISMTGQCRTAIYLLMRAGRFPLQRKIGIGGRSVGWSHREIQVYIRITLAGGEYLTSEV